MIDAEFSPIFTGNQRINAFAANFLTILFSQCHIYLTARGIVESQVYKFSKIFIFYLYFQLRLINIINLKCQSQEYFQDSLRVHQSVRPSLCPFYSQNCLHILSKVSRSAARQPTLGVGSIRCGSSKIQKSY